MVQFASSLFENEEQVEEVRRVLEVLLREGDADVAAERLSLAVEALGELGHPIAALCRAAEIESMVVNGWDELAYEVARHDRHGRPVTAIGIDLCARVEGGPVEPVLETSFYSDEAFAFSTATREELTAAYSVYGPEWRGAFEGVSHTVSVAGLGELQSAIDWLAQECQSGNNRNGADHDALFVGSALIAVRVHQAMREMVLAYGLPRPMAMIAGSNDSLLPLDAPVVSTPEYIEYCLGDWDESDAEAATEGAVSEDAYASLVDSDAPRSAEPEAFKFEPLAEAVAETPAEPFAEAEEAEAETEGDAEVSTGSLLRRNLREKAAEAPAEEAPAEAPARRTGMFSRLMRRAG